MTRVVVKHSGITDLANDLAGIAAGFKRQAPQIVRRNARAGNRFAQNLARARSGPHGALYFRRLTFEMTGPLTGEFGPEGEPKTEFVGAGFRHGLNMDLLDTADVIGPRFANDVINTVDGLFW